MISARFGGQLGAFGLNLAFEAPMQGVTALFGPSGCGKTTTLRCVAGLTHLAGRLSVGGEIWQDDAAGIYRLPHQRPIGYVFQEASLFPHLSVRANLLYGHKRALEAGAKEETKLDDVVDLLGLARLLDRSPAPLSGGERQRVAVGRALLSQPRLLLMDEPLAALDRMAKDEILPYFEALHERLSIPILYVSHDIAEIERLADTLVMMDQGRLVAAGPLAAMEADPNLPLLQSPEAAVTLEGRIAEIDLAYGLTTLSVPGGRLIVPGRQGTIGEARRLRISASDVSFIKTPPTDSTILNTLPVRIVSLAPHDAVGVQTNVVARLGRSADGVHIVGRITRKSQEALGLTAGAEVYAQIKSVALIAARAGATIASVARIAS